MFLDKVKIYTYTVESTQLSESLPHDLFFLINSGKESVMRNKNCFLLVLTLSLIVMFSYAPKAQAAMGDSLLRLGSSGIDVVELQTKLNYLGYDVTKADGFFGSLTQKGVINFQTAQGLKADGLVGPITAITLNNTYAAKIHLDKANAIIATSKQYLGIKYQWGGTSPITGFDCSGFVSYVFAKHDIILPRISRDQFNVGTLISFTNLVPGDIVFFSFAKNGIVDHDGIYIGSGQFINSSSSKGVTIYTLGAYWQSLFVGCKRVF